MHARRGRGVVHGHEIAPHLIRDERAEGRDQQRDRGEALVQRGEGGGAVVDIVRPPEATARGAHVPIGQVIHEVLERAARRRGVIRGETLGDALRGGVEARERPAIHGRAVLRCGRGVVRGPAIREGGIGDEERVGVPEGEEEPAAGLIHHVQAEAERLPRALGGEQVPAEGIRARMVDDGPGLHDVALRLAHLLAIAIEDQPEAHHVAVRRLVEQQGALGEQRVEPPARLIKRLAHEVGGEAPVEALLALERIVVLREWHGARVKPHVSHLGHAVSGAAAGAAHGNVVDPWTVRVEVLTHIHRRTLAQFGKGADGRDRRALVTAPEGQRSAPIALPGDGPVDVALEPAAEPAVAHVLRMPAHVRVEGQHAVAHVGGADVPRRLGVVEERRAAPPAVRVRVLVRLLAEHESAGLQVLDQRAVGVLHERARRLRHLIREQSLTVDGVGCVEPMLARGAHVVLAEGRRDVHDSRPVRRGDEVALHHHMPAGDFAEGRQILGPGEFGCRDHPLHHGILAHHRAHQRFGHDQPLVPVNHHRVVDVGIDGGSLVGGQRPRRGGPHEERQRRFGGQRVPGVCPPGGSVPQGGLSPQRELHVDGRIRHVLVALGHLVAAQGRAAARAVRHDLVALVHQALVEQRGEAPPHRLDVIGVHGAVRL